MEKEIYINDLEHLMNSSQEQDKNNIIFNPSSKRQAEESKEKFNKKIFFKESLFNIPIELYTIEDIGLGKAKNIDLYSYYNIDNKLEVPISSKQLLINLDSIFKPYISLSKIGNKLSNDLNNELNEPLIKLKDEINESDKQLKLLIYEPIEPITEIFDPIFAITQIDSLPYDFINTLENLVLCLDELKNNITQILNISIIKLNTDISEFLNISHNYLNGIMNNIIDTTNILNSEQNKIMEISSFYLNEKNYNSSYYEYFSGYKNIFFNYYKKDIDIILPIVNKILDNSYEKTFFFIQRFNNRLGNISERISNRNLEIIQSKPEDYNKAIEYINSIKNKMNEILIKIKNETLENILLENGFFDSQTKLEERINYYDQKILDALNISYILDNDKLIDNTFDDAIRYFKDNFFNILKYMQNILKENFPFEENALKESYFDNKYFQQIDEFFISEKDNIINYLNQENEDYLKSMDNILNNFIISNELSFKQSLFKLMNDFDIQYFRNFNNAYNDFLFYVLNDINETIKKSEILGNEYLNNVNNANSYHITQGFINKYNTFIDNNENLTYFIKYDLKADLKNKYLGIINDTKKLLQNITFYNDIIFNKNYKQLLSLSEYQNDSIQSLLERLNNYITEETFEQNYLPSINELIEISLDNLTNIKNSFENIYNDVAKKSNSESLNDYDILHISGNDRYCCDYVWK